MRILSIGNFGHGWDGSICDEEHIAGALEELGHVVLRLPRNAIPDLSGSGYEYDVDFTLVAQWDGYGDLSHLPHPLVYWAFDYQNDGQEWHERLVAEADLYLSKRIADSKYPNWQWLSQDFSPKFLEALPTRTFKDEEQPIDVLFTGSYLPWATERNETLKAIDDKFNLVIHSVNEWAGFKDVRPPIMDEGLPALYKSAKINIAIDHTLEAGYWSDRVAQILCCGGFVLNRYVPMMEARLPDDGLVYFYSVEDCLTKIEQYLNQDAKRAVTASHGRAYADHRLRVNNRAKDLLTIVNAHLTI